MAFDIAYEKVAGMLTRRHSELLGGEKRTWALDTGESFADQIDETFKRVSDNQAWSDARIGPSKAISHTAAAQLRGRIAWMGACNRDLRTQYAQRTSCAAKSAAEHRKAALVGVTNALRCQSYFKLINDG